MSVRKGFTMPRPFSDYSLRERVNLVNAKSTPGRRIGDPDMGDRNNIRAVDLVIVPPHRPTLSESSACPHA